MDRRIDDVSVLNRFAREFCGVIERHVEYMIVSGFSAIASGRTRGTEDIDMIVCGMSGEEFSELHRDLVKSGFECMQSDDAGIVFGRYLERGISVRYVWKGRILPEMEIHFVKDEIDEYQMGRRIKMESTGLDVWFAPIEGNIAFKEEWLKSDKDVEDAKHLRIVYEGEIDEGEIDKIKEMIRRVRN